MRNGPLQLRWISVAALFRILGVSLVAYTVWHLFLSREVGAARAAEREHPLFVDDRLMDKHPVFDNALVDSRPFGTTGNRWELNASSAVIALEIVDIAPGDGAMLRSYPSFSAAAKALSHRAILPSVNLIDGKAKEFDDGLITAVHSWAAAGEAPGGASLLDILTRLKGRLQPDSEAYGWLWAALKTGALLDAPADALVPSKAEPYLRVARDPAIATAVGPYEWSDSLGATFRLIRFLSVPFSSEHEVPREIRAAFSSDEKLAADYQSLLRLLHGLSGKARLPSFLDPTDPSAQNSVSFIPRSTTREDALFETLFGRDNVPLDADLMAQILIAVRSGRLDLRLKEDSSWYEYQANALETLLLPEKGAEHEKLMLTAKYKERLLQAFAAMLTKRRETHILLGGAASTVGSDSDSPPLDIVRPRLRLEPNPTYYLRMARSYAFLELFLNKNAAGALRRNGLRESGERDRLSVELARMKKMFYGFHLLSCEDIGLQHQLRAGELSDPERAMETASSWLGNWRNDEDLALDTRVAVPFLYSGERKKLRYWTTLGVRPARLKFSYAIAPVWRSMGHGGSWQEIPSNQVAGGEAIIFVEDFAEIERSADTPLTRASLRTAADGAESRAELLAVLRR